MPAKPCLWQIFPFAWWEKKFCRGLRIPLPETLLPSPLPSPSPTTIINQPPATTNPPIQSSSTTTTSSITTSTPRDAFDHRIAIQSSDTAIPISGTNTFPTTPPTTTPVRNRTTCHHPEHTFSGQIHLRLGLTSIYTHQTSL